MNRHTLMRQLVIEEATNLKKHVSKEELNKLNFDRLNSERIDLCVYGQMTGNCFSERATYLMKTCCKRVYHTDKGSVRECSVNGSPENINRSYFWSPIEVFIDQYRNQENGNNEQLIKFLKGEIDVLNFK
jgi:hypothetical protein